MGLNDFVTHVVVALALLVASLPEIVKQGLEGYSLLLLLGIAAMIALAVIDRAGVIDTWGEKLAGAGR